MSNISRVSVPTWLLTALLAQARIEGRGAATTAPPGALAEAILCGAHPPLSPEIISAARRLSGDPVGCRGGREG